MFPYCLGARRCKKSQGWLVAPIADPSLSHLL
jgi:hypothetical protein